jgi:hypothetical protein
MSGFYSTKVDTNRDTQVAAAITIAGITAIVSKRPLLPFDPNMYRNLVKHDGNQYSFATTTRRRSKMDRSWPWMEGPHNSSHLWREMVSRSLKRHLLSTSKFKYSRNKNVALVNERDIQDQMINMPPLKMHHLHARYSAISATWSSPILGLVLISTNKGRSSIWNHIARSTSA